MKAMIQRDRRALVFGAVLLAALLCLQFVLMPWLSHWGGVRQRQSIARAGLQSVKRELDRLDDLQGRLRPIHGEAIAKPLKGEEDAQVAFIQRSQQVLGAAGIGFTSVAPQSPRPIKASGGLVLVPIQVRGAKCKIEQLSKFLAEIRKSDMLVLVDRIDMQSDPQKPEEIQINALVLSTLAVQEIKP